MRAIENLFGHQNQRRIAKWGSFIGAAVILNEIYNVIGFQAATTIIGPVKFGHFVVAALALSGYWWYCKRFT